ncbi:hypothetical protein CEXT_327791 [Caerostris extrusa]|uniref:Uncharacterized protein n=1 Tax=Caerostris extrusa TaxID=172846 RepID=A0AAV4M494_CAEEX|nr:hypothetical protein CEXT_327791 [Caerostris extrusa]
MTMCGKNRKRANVISNAGHIIRLRNDKTLAKPPWYFLDITDNKIKSDNKVLVVIHSDNEMKLFIWPHWIRRKSFLIWHASSRKTFLYRLWAFTVIPSTALQ